MVVDTVLPEPGSSRVIVFFSTVVPVAGSSRVIVRCSIMVPVAGSSRVIVRFSILRSSAKAGALKTSTAVVARSTRLILIPPLARAPRQSAARSLC
jgi:hypothetical protein